MKKEFFTERKFLYAPNKFGSDGGADNENKPKKRPPEPAEIYQAIIDDVYERFGNTSMNLNCSYVENYDREKQTSSISYVGGEIGSNTFELPWIEV